MTDPNATDTPIALATFNARWVHCAHALRLLRAGLGDLRSRCRVYEFTVGDDPRQAAATVLADAPQVIGVSCSVWNLAATCALCEAVRAAAPATAIIAGGPEVGRRDHPPRLRALVDTIVIGEGEEVFADLVRSHLAGASLPSTVHATPVQAEAVPDVIAEYSPTDCSRRLVYIESTRGCPNRCGYCTAAIAEPPRRLPPPHVRAHIAALVERGARILKFLDRSINANPTHATDLLATCAAHHRPGLRVHMEMLPDRFDDALHRAIAAYPAGGLQLEVGIQSLNPTVLAASGRHCNIDRALAHLRRLAATGTHLHLDLIAGLPGEDLAGFAHGFDTVFALGVQEIQVGILKRLRDTAFARDLDSGYRFESTPPYTLLANTHLSFAEVERLRRFARYVERIHNSGDLPRTAALIAAGPSAFAGFMACSDHLWRRFDRTHAIGLGRFCAALHDHLVTERGVNPATATAALAADWAAKPQRHGPPDCIQEAVRRLRRESDSPIN